VSREVAFACDVAERLHARVDGVVPGLETALNREGAPMLAGALVLARLCAKGYQPADLRALVQSLVVDNAERSPLIAHAAAVLARSCAELPGGAAVVDFVRAQTEAHLDADRGQTERNLGKLCALLARALSSGDDGAPPRGLLRAETVGFMLPRLQGLELRALAQAARVLASDEACALSGMDATAYARCFARPLAKLLRADDARACEAGLALLVRLSLRARLAAPEPEWADVLRAAALAHSNARVRRRALEACESLLRELGWAEAKTVLALGVADDCAVEAWHRRLPCGSLAARLSAVLAELNPGTEPEQKPLRARFERAWPAAAARLVLMAAREVGSYADDCIFRDALDPAAAVFTQLVPRASRAPASSQVLFASSSATQRHQRPQRSASSQLLFTASQALGGNMVLATQAADARYAATQEAFGAPPLPAGMGGPGAATLPSSQRAPSGRVFRAFRQGDFPDVQVPVKDVVEPWIELCGLDSEAARATLVAVVRAVVADARLASLAVRQALAAGVAAQLDAAVGGDAAFVSLLCALAAELGGAPVSDEAVVRACTASGTYAAGALLLEQRASPAHALYGALKETDLLMGSVADAATRRALEAEMLGDFVEARKLLQGAADSPLARLVRLRCDFASQEWRSVLAAPDAPPLLKLSALLRSEPTQERACELTAQVGGPCADAAMLQIMGLADARGRKDWTLAETRALQAADALVERWAQLSPMAVSARVEQLAPLAQLASIVDAVEAQRAGTAAGLLARWSWSAPDAATDALETWEAVEWARVVCLDALDVAVDAGAVRAYTFGFLLKAAGACQRQGAFEVAKRYLGRALKLAAKAGPDDTVARVHRAVFDLQLAEAQSRAVLDKIRGLVDDEPKHVAKYGQSAWLHQFFAACRALLDASERAANPAGYRGEHAAAAVAGLERALQLAVGDAPTLAAAHLELGALCADDAGRPAEAVANVLAAMALGSRDACAFFPRVLNLVGKSPAAIAAFETGVRRVPSRALAEWATQLLAMMDLGVHWRETLYRLASEHRWAAAFPFRVARQALQLRGGALSAETAATVGEMARLLGGEATVDPFCRSLAMLGDPLMRVADGLTLVLRNRTQGVWDVVRRELLADVFGLGLDGAVTFEFKHRAGKANQAFAKSRLGEFAPLLLRAHPVPSADEVGKLRKAIGSEVEEAKRRKKQGSVEEDVEKRALWLSAFDGGEDGDLQLPAGHDEGEAVAGFEPRVLALSSLRAPKRLGVRGRLGDVRRYLVKNGEDLRLDQRIETLFARFNALWAADGACAKRALSVRTYQVIPVSLQTGLIEWVPDTRTVLDVLGEAMQADPALKDADFPARQDSALLRAWSDLGAGPKYTGLYADDNAEAVASAFAAVCKSVPDDLLKRHAAHVSSSPESFLQMRTAMARSFAALSVASYVLGIGDRHLENFLLAKGGELVAIDFGYSFGIGTTMLPVPELLPMRFSRNLRGFLEPVPGQRGQVRYGMVAGMHALRENRKRLLDLCQIFATEPLVDWASAMKDKAAATLDTMAQIVVADLKLQGARPSGVLCKELRSRQDKGDAYVREVLRAAGCEAESLRVVPVGEQVEELLQLATDAGLESRAYVGQRAWL